MRAMKYVCLSRTERYGRQREKWDSERSVRSWTCSAPVSCPFLKEAGSVPASPHLRPPEGLIAYHLLAVPVRPSEGLIETVGLSALSGC